MGEEHNIIFPFREVYGLTRSLLTKKRIAIIRQFIGSDWPNADQKTTESAKASKQNQRNEQAVEQGPVSHWDEHDGWTAGERKKLMDHTQHHGSLTSLFVEGEAAILGPELWGYDEKDSVALENLFDISLGPCLSPSSCHSWPEDRVLQVIRCSCHDGNIGLTAAFAVNVVLDIQKLFPATANTLGSVDAAALRSMDVHEVCDNMLKLIGDETYRRDARPTLFFAQNFVDGHDARESLEANQGQHLALQRNIRAYVADNAFARGNIDLFLRLAQSASRLAAVDEAFTIKTCIHVYNAALALGMLTSPWEDMEKLISLHGSDGLFKDMRPTSLEDALSIIRLLFPQDYNLGDIYPNRGQIKRARGKCLGGSLDYLFHAILDLLFRHMFEGVGGGVDTTSIHDAIIVLQHHGAGAIREDENTDRRLNLLQVSFSFPSALNFAAPAFFLVQKAKCTRAAQTFQRFGTMSTPYLL